MSARIAVLFFALASACALQGCPAPVVQLNRLPSSSPLPKAVPIPADSEYVHEPSGYAFPIIVANFQRVALVRYDTSGLDVSAGYNSGIPGCLIRLTIYVSPAPKMSFMGADPAVVRDTETEWLNSAYDRWKREIASSHPQARLVLEDEREQAGLRGKKAVYNIDTDQSELFVFLDRRTWFLTYRVSFPASCSAEAHTVLQGFFASWHGRSAG